MVLTLRTSFNQLHYVTCLILLLAYSTSSQLIVETIPGFPGKLPFKLETGYIGVGESENVQLFYYFIESENNPNEDPLMLWLTGGPGCSALSGLLYEIGPFTTIYTGSATEVPALRLNPYSWTKVSNIIFLDQPVGTGYSYGKTPEAYSTSDSVSASHAYEFLNKWLFSHPRFLANPLYIAGDSYTGIIIPLIVQKIYNGNDVGAELSLNIKGYILGNALTDNFIDFNSRTTFAHRMGLLSDHLYESAKINCKGNFLSVESHNILCQNDLQKVAKSLEKIRNPQILEPWCGSWSAGKKLLSSDEYSTEMYPTYITQPLPLVAKSWCRDYDYLSSYAWANDKTVQEALHVEWLRCNRSLTYDLGMEKTNSYIFDVHSTIDIHRNLTQRNARALIYSGDHDMVVPHVGTEEWIKLLELEVEKEWRPWFVDGQIAGFTEKYSLNNYELTYATVKGGGHTAPEYKPKECAAMISRWLINLDL